MIEIIRKTIDLGKTSQYQKEKYKPIPDGGIP